MADLVRLAYYPFLPEVRDVVREQGPAVQDLLTGNLYRDIRRRATERVRRLLGDGVLESPRIVGGDQALDELLTHAVVRMALVCLGDRLLASRFAARDAARVRRALHDDSLSGLREVMEVLGLPIDTAEEAGWRIHFSDHLKHAPVRQEWKLVMQRIDAGWIRVDRRMAESLCEEGVRRRIESDLHREMAHPAPADLRVALQPYLDELGPELAEARKGWDTGDFGPIMEAAFPPCIVQLFEQMKAGAMVPHHGRFAFASFLGTIGMSADQVLDYMSQLPNFSRDKSEYQIRHIVGELGVEAYTPPGCGTMQTQGICPLERRDDICFQIKHPLSYYRRRRKRVPEPVRDESGGDADKGGGKAADGDAVAGREKAAPPAGKEVSA